MIYFWNKTKKTISVVFCEIFFLYLQLFGLEVFFVLNFEYEKNVQSKSLAKGSTGESKETFLEIDGLAKGKGKIL